MTVFARESEMRKNLRTSIDCTRLTSLLRKELRRVSPQTETQVKFTEVHLNFRY
jgi:hypothetical protein